MAWYKTGTVSVTAGSNAVIGTGTSFIKNARVGDAFRGPDGRWYEVTNAASDTALSISPDYQGPTLAAGSYSLAPMQGYVKESADQLNAATKTIAGTATDMSAQVNQAKASADSATASAGTATTKASEASASSANATSRAAAALVSQNAAKTSETNAKTYADQAAASASIPLSTPLTGFSASNTAPIVAADTILTAFGKAQGQANLGGWAVSKQTVADINAVSISQKFDISDAAGTANIPFRLGSTTVRFDAGSTGIVSQWGNFASSKHWQMLIFDRTSTNIAYRRMSSGVVLPDDYIVVYPTGKTVLDISQGGTGSATGVPNMVGATASVAGVKGLVPAPAAGDQAKFLAGDGTYKAPPSSAWGAIGGTLSAQTDLQSALDAIKVKRWQSASIAISSTPTSFSHSLGVVPLIASVQVTLTAAVGGWPIGTVFKVPSHGASYGGSGAANYGFQIANITASSFTVSVLNGGLIIGSTAGLALGIASNSYTTQVELLAWQ
jgi:hypothetical protein